MSYFKLFIMASIDNIQGSGVGGLSPSVDNAHESPDSTTNSNLLDALMSLSRDMATKEHLDNMTAATKKGMDDMLCLFHGLLKKYVDELSGEIVKLVQQQQFFETEINELRDRLNKFENMPVFSDRMSLDNHIISTMKSTEERIVNRIKSSESNHRVKVSGRGFRDNKIILEGISEHVDHKEFIRDLSSALEITDMSDNKINYMMKWTTGADTDNTRVLVRVGFSDPRDKFMFVNKEVKRKLKEFETSSRFHGIKIYQDRSYADREHFKTLLSEAERRNVELQRNNDHSRIWVVCGSKVINVRNRNAVGR